MALMAFIVAAMYAVIAFAVLPRLGRAEPGQPRVLRIARWGAMAFFTGCAVTHVDIGISAVSAAMAGADHLNMSATMSGPDTTTTLVRHLIPHLAQIIGGGLFLGIARSHLEWTVVPRDIAEKLREREMLFRAAFERAPAGIAMVSVTDGRPNTILQANPALCAMVERKDDELREGTYRDLFARADRDEMLADLRRVVQGEIVLPREHVLSHADGRQVSVAVETTLVRETDGSALFAVVQFRDLAGQRRADALRAAQHAVMQAVSGGESVSEGMALVVRKVCATLGWAGGEYWQTRVGRKDIVRLTSWWSPEFAHSALAKAEELTFARGQGLPGAVWASGALMWMGDLDDRPDGFQRAPDAQTSGLNAVIGIPIRSGDQPGVLVFFATEMAEPDQELTIALEAISAHVGRFVERRRAEDLLHLSRRQAEQSEQDQLVLAQERHRLRQAQPVGQVGFCEWDITNDVLTWSDALFGLYGVGVGEFSAQEVTARCLAPAEAEAMAEIFRGCAESGEPFVHRHHAVRLSDDATREFEVRGERLPLVPGRPVRVTGMAMDVTEAVVLNRG
jgi:PAS domain S-box-containing protein